MRIATLVFLLVSLARAQDSAPVPTPDPASFFPKGTPIFFEADGLSRAAGIVSASPLLLSLVQESQRKVVDGFLQAISDAKVEQLAGGVLPSVIATTRWIVVARSGDPAKLGELVARFAKSGSGAAPPVVAEHPPYTLIVDSKETLDLATGLPAEPDRALPAREDFRRYRTRCPRGAIRLHLDLAKMLPPMARVGVIKNDDIGAVLFASHLMHTAKTARTLSGAIELGATPSLELFAEIDPLPKLRAFAETRPAERVVEPPAGTVARMSLPRDVKQFWVDRTALLSDAARAPLAEFQNNLGILMGGLAVEDVFAGLGSAFDLYVTRGDAATLEGHRYPAAALVATIADPALEGELLLGFQTTLGVVNAQRAQERQPRYFQESAKHRDVLIACARILPESLPDPSDDRVQIEPSLATVAGRVIIGSTRSIVRALVDQILDGRLSPRAPGDEIEVFGPPAAAALRDAGALVVAKMMLEGRSENAAKTLLDQIATLLGKVRRGHAAIEVSGKMAVLRARIEADTLFTPAPESR